MPSILQWNLRGLRTSLQDLQAILSQRCPTLVCLQETKLHPDAHCSLNGYTVFRKDCPADTVAHGGVLLAVHYSMPSSHVKLRTVLQAVAAQVMIDHRTITVCSIYLPRGRLSQSKSLRSWLPSFLRLIFSWVILTLTARCGAARDLTLVAVS